MSSPKQTIGNDPKGKRPERLIQVVFAVLGLAGAYWSYRWAYDLLSYFQGRDWNKLVQEGVFWLMVASLSLMFITSPFGNGRIAMIIRTVVSAPLALIFVVNHYFGYVLFPTLVAFAIYALPLWTWQGLEYLGVNVPIGFRAFMYVGYVFASLLFTYTGQWFVRWCLRSIDSKWNYDRLLFLVQPNLVRIYIYGIVGVGHLLANLERLSQQPLLSSPFWQAYKDISMDVLLTFVILDRVAKMAQDFVKNHRGAGKS